MTRRPPLPRYSYPYGKLASQMRMAQSSIVVSQYQGLTLVHFSAQRKRFLWDRGYA